LLAKAVSLMPKSKKLWLQASRKEQDLLIKKSILLKALEQIPCDLDLWKETISLANPDEAKSLLYKATEALPDSTELWLALAKLETYENARVVLNKAREHLPGDHTIWINAAKLEEAQGNTGQVEKIVSRAVKKLASVGVGAMVKRDMWMKEAVGAEEGGSVVTARAIIKATMEYGMDEYMEGIDATNEKEKVKVYKRVWNENADACIA
jgi:pre-mRNA-processing factor 6